MSARDEEQICKKLGISIADFERMRPVARQFRIDVNTDSPLEDETENKDQSKKIGGFSIRGNSY